MGKFSKPKAQSNFKGKNLSKGKQKLSNSASFKHHKGPHSKTLHKQPTPKFNKRSSLQKSKNVNQMDIKLAKKALPKDAKPRIIETFSTVLKGLSQCTNLPLETIQRYWINQSTKNKEVCAVLAAITSVVQQQTNKSSIAAYFSGLINAFSSVEQDETAAAIGYLLSKTVMNVPSTELRVSFSEVSTLLLNILAKYVSKDDSDAPTAYLISILSTLSVIIRNQENSSWESELMMKSFQIMLSYTVHSKPKIRKAAQNAVCSILTESDVENDFSLHPAASTTAEFCVSLLQISEGVSTDVSVCHVLQLFGRALPCFSQSSLHKVCEAVISLMVVSDLVVKLVCFQTLQEMFVHHSKHTTLTPDLNGRIITALYDYYPNTSDEQMCLTWLSVIEKALLNLCVNYLGCSFETEAVALAVIHISKIFSITFKLILSENSIIAEAASSTLQLLLKDAILRLCNKDIPGLTKDNHMKFVSSIFKSLADGVKHKYHDAWKHVFQIAETVLNSIVNPSHFPIVKPFLKSIIDLRTTSQLECATELETIVGAAITNLGPNLVLEAVPLIVEETQTYVKFPHSWVLPLLKKCVKHAELAFYYEEILPLAAKMRALAEKFKRVNDSVNAEIYRALYMQCWELLSCFCEDAVDISVAFPKVARIMGRALNEKRELRSIVIEALHNVAVASEASEQFKTTLSQYAKNFLPILFNIYTENKTTSNRQNKENKTDIETDQESKRPAILETIRLYLRLTEEDLICSYFSKIQDKVFSDEFNLKQFAVFDLLTVMTPYVTKDKIEKVYNEIKPMLVSDGSQKKAYRVLEEVLAANSPSSRSFVKHHLPELQDLLLDGLPKAQSAAKESRIKCLQKLYIQLHKNPETRNDSEDVLKTVLPVVVLCTKDTNQSRVAAFDLIIATAKAYISSPEDGSSADALDRYFEIIVAGLAGNPAMIRAAVVALSRLVFEFKDLMSSTLLEQTIGNICLLLGCNTAEVIQVCLGFVTVSLRVFSKQFLAQYVTDILNAFLKWNDSNKRHFRFKVKLILQRLVQKFGFETIFSMAPEDLKKTVSNLQKDTKCGS